MAARSRGKLAGRGWMKSRMPSLHRIWGSGPRHRPGGDRTGRAGHGSVNPAHVVVVTNGQGHSKKGTAPFFLISILTFLSFPSQNHPFHCETG